MKITGTAVRLGAFAVVLLFFTAVIIVVFGQMRFDRTTGYSAIFTNVSGLRNGQFVRASGVEVGKVSNITLIDGGQRARVDFAVDRSLPLYEGTTAAIRYLNLIGDRYLELKKGDSDKKMPGGATIPLERTQPALDLDALVGSFRPLFRALDPQKINTIAQSIITIFQGQGGTINDILDQTASLTSALGDRDQAIGEVIKDKYSEHGHLDLSRCRDKPRVGDRLTIIPNHACAVSNLHDRIHGLQGDRLERIFDVRARGRVQ